LSGLQGSLKEFDITDVLQLIQMNKKDGCLEITAVDDFGKIYFENGAVIHAETKERFGENAVHKILLLSEGTFKFNLDVKSPKKSINLPIQHLMLEAARKIDEWKQIEKIIPSVDLMVKIVENPETGTENIKLTSEEWKILTFVDNQSTIKEISLKVNQSEFETAKVFFGLITSGLVFLEEQNKLEDILSDLEKQVEEEENDNEIIDKLKIAGENKEALSALDAELAKRLPPKDEEESI